MNYASAFHHLESITVNFYCIYQKLFFTDTFVRYFEKFGKCTVRYPIDNKDQRIRAFVLYDQSDSVAQLLSNWKKIDEEKYECRVDFDNGTSLLVFYIS